MFKSIARYGFPIVVLDNGENAAAFTLSNQGFGVRTARGEHVQFTKADARDLVAWIQEHLKDSEPGRDPFTGAILGLDAKKKFDVKYVLEMLKSNSELAHRSEDALTDIAQRIVEETTGEIRLDQTAVLIWHDHENDMKCVSIVTQRFLDLDLADLDQL